MVFFLPMTTGWIFDISLLLVCENSIKNQFCILHTGPQYGVFVVCLVTLTLSNSPNKLILVIIIYQVCMYYVVIN